MATGKVHHWTCPTCGRHATVGENDRFFGTIGLAARAGVQDQEGFHVSASLTRCPNPDCKKSQLTVRVHHAEAAEYGNYPYFRVQPDFDRPAGIGHFTFLPTAAKPLSAHVPASVRQDYEEACLILQLSPKAAATLARRALQGMVRHFWSVSMSRLADELKAIEGRCDQEVYKAMMSLKSVGNIGAHPERDIALIVDIEPGEAQQLVDLIHLLDDEWYVARAKKEQRIAAVQLLGEQKKTEQKPPGA
jgi:hypothetical protein